MSHFLGSVQIAEGSDLIAESSAAIAEVMDLIAENFAVIAKVMDLIDEGLKMIAAGFADFSESAAITARHSAIIVRYSAIVRRSSVIPALDAGIFDDSALARATVRNGAYTAIFKLR